MRRWRRKAQVDAGECPGTTSSEHPEIRKLKREVAELRRANEILKLASALCAAERGAIPGFLTSRGYRGARTRSPSEREVRDEQLAAELRTVHRENYSVYGVKKMHQLRSKDRAVAATSPLPRQAE